MLAKKNNNVEVTILTSNKSNIETLDIKKFNKEYPTLKVAKTNKFHDRFIIIDKKEMYHIGASIKDLGKKCFGINKIEDKEIIEKIINKLESWLIMSIDDENERNFIHMENDFTLLLYNNYLTFVITTTLLVKVKISWQ